MKIYKILQFSIKISEILRPRLLRGWPAGLGSVPESSKPTGPARMDARRFFWGNMKPPRMQGFEVADPKYFLVGVSSPFFSSE